MTAFTLEVGLRSGRGLLACRLLESVMPFLRLSAKRNRAASPATVAGIDAPMQWRAAQQAGWPVREKVLAGEPVTLPPDAAVSRRVGEARLRPDAGLPISLFPPRSPSALTGGEASGVATGGREVRPALLPRPAPFLRQALPLHGALLPRFRAGQETGCGGGRGDRGGSAAAGGIPPSSARGSETESALAMESETADRLPWRSGGGAAGRDATGGAGAGMAASLSGAPQPSQAAGSHFRELPWRSGGGAAGHDATGGAGAGTAASLSGAPQPSQTAGKDFRELPWRSGGGAARHDATGRGGGFGKAPQRTPLDTPAFPAGMLRGAHLVGEVLKQAVKREVAEAFAKGSDRMPPALSLPDNAAETPPGEAFDDGVARQLLRKMRSISEEERFSRGLR